MSLMTWLGRFRRRSRFDEDDFEDEIRSHLAIAANERVASGDDPTAARQAAVKDFGNVTLTTEAARGVWTPGWLHVLHDLTSDVRYAVRALLKNWAFSLAVIAVLTLGIGLNGVVFAMLKGMAFSPIAGVAHSSRLAVIYDEPAPDHQMRVSYPDYLRLRADDTSFADLMGSSLITAGLGRGRGSRSIWGELVTGNYFQVLNVRAGLGRVLQPSDTAVPSGSPVAVISNTLWRTDFESDPNIVGKTIELNHSTLTVVGVADPSFHGTIVGYDIEVYVPITQTAEIKVFDDLRPTSSANVLADRRAPVLFPQGFLRPGVTLAHATAETGAIWSTIRATRPPEDAAHQFRVARFADSPTGAQQFLVPALVVLAAMGGLVLLIACANIAGLVVVRGLSRQGEIAMRLALGATRSRIVRLLIVENLVLALPAAVLGVIVTAQGIPIFVAAAEALAAPQHLFFNMGVDRLVITVAVLVSCGCALVFGFAPALRSSRIDLVTVMKEDLSPRGAARGRLRSTLVVAQVAVSLLLLFGAALVTRSLEAARSANPGFDAQHVSSVLVDLRQNGYDEAHGRVFYRRLLDLARGDAGVESATLAAVNPMGLIDTHSETVQIDGYVPRRDEDLSFMYNTISSDYFSTLRIGVPFGREFLDRDDDTSAPVAIVNTTLADRFFGGGGQALGKRVKLGTGDWRTIVGVVADVKYSRINEAPRPYVYVPFFQSYLSQMILHARGPAPVEHLVALGREHVAALDGDLPILYAKPFAERLHGALFIFNVTATMLFIFGAAGMVLAALGTYGLVSYTVKQSRREIGIRMALGASGASVIRGFMSRGLRLGGLGASIGLVAALGVGQLLRSALYGVSATDPLSFLRAIAIVLAGVVLASVIPAWRAARIDPLRALRRE
jgi:predicted permease